MDEEMGRGLQMKHQDELIGEEGTYKKRIGLNRFKVPTQSTSKNKFVDAQSDSLSTIPRSKEEHEELDLLNNNFSERLDEVNKNTCLSERKENQLRREIQKRRLKTKTRSTKIKSD